MGTVEALSFGVLLKRYRRAVGLTQEALATRASYSAIYIRMLERGARTPLPATVAVLAEALQLSDEQRSALTSAARSRRDAGAGERVVAEAALPIGGFLGALPVGPLVAREAELGQICLALDAVMSGVGRLLLLAGEPGIGKTRLAQEVMLAARQRGYVVATGRCYEPQQSVAHFPFLEALALAFAAAPPAVQTALPRRWPEVGRLLPAHSVESAAGRPAGAPSPAGDQTEQLRVFSAVAGFLQALAEDRPAALLLDDLHWADSASLGLFVHLARQTRNARVLLVGTYRAVEAHLNRPLEAALRDLGREQLLQRVAVGPLSPAGTAALLASSLGTAAVSVDLAAHLHERAEGNPFFTREILQALIERGDICQRNGQWEQRAVADLLVPETVRLVIGERVARLRPQTQVVLREASVWGQTFTFADLANTSAHTEDELEGAFDEATGTGLVRETGLEGYAFAHVLVQQTLYAEMPARRKQRLHRAVGEALEQLPDPLRERRVADLAYHYARSDRQDKALTYLIQAAERACGAAAYHEEAALLGQAIALAARSEPQPVLTELRMRRGKALRTIAQWPEAERVLEAALAALAPEQVEPRIQVLLDLAEVQHWLVGPSGIRRYAVEALALAEQIGRDDQAAQAMCRLALADSSAGEVRAAVVRYQRAFERVGKEHLAPLVAGVEYAGHNLYWLGEYAAAVERSREAVALARQSHETTYTARALANLGLALTGSGQYDEALEAFAEARQFARDHRTGQWLARSTAMCGGLHLEVFDFSGAEALAQEARAVGRSIDWPQAVVSAGIDLVLNFARRQEIGRAEALVPEIAHAAAQAQGIHSWLWRLRLAQAQAEIALARGDWLEALHWATDAVSQSHRRGRVKYQVAGLQTRGQALAALGQTRMALASLRRAVVLARPVGDPAMFLRAATALLAAEGDDTLLTEARAAADRISAALPDEELSRCFKSAEAVRQPGELPGHSRLPTARVANDYPPGHGRSPNCV